MLLGMTAKGLGRAAVCRYKLAIMVKPDDKFLRFHHNLAYIDSVVMSVMGLPVHVRHRYIWVEVLLTLDVVSDTMHQK